MPTKNSSSHLPTKSRAPGLNRINGWFFSILFLGFGFLFFFFFKNPTQSLKEMAEGVPKSIYDITVKVEVNGKEATTLYKFLKSKKGGFFGDGIKWNFTKFLVDKDGKVVERYAPTTSPLKIEKTIQSLLGVA
ncbi:uncharacterized protein A4U43_C09F4340 [Asparagus officinalis]|uniref:Glutathione peroxidase n=1 Tax=Asparagus officinalis TaxID=4686 RepID=A0A5P1E591_ASPOF|nr:uncharacterized protein A4U43_C09F4340 [Asparagus officinalis]